MSLHDATWRGFASDNYSGVLPEVMAAVERANGGHQVSYGGDDYTAALGVKIRELFGEKSEIFPLFNGTGANVVALTSMMPRWGAVICSSSGHIHTDEGGAPERVSGLKLYPVTPVGGKLTPDLVATQAYGFGDEHRAQPLVVSITQSTEVGTVYTPEEVSALADYTHSKGMLLHMDGARLFNAAASLNIPFADFTRSAGVDVLTLGATKNGALGAEAIVVLNPDAVEGILYLRKMSMQLPSKMRFVSAQILALLQDSLGVKTAAISNAMATLLRSTLQERIDQGRISGLAFSHTTQSNGVFAMIDLAVAERLRQKVRFYDWDQSRGEVRWMCSFDTTAEDILYFADLIEAELQ
jgi:threonine aldolase